MMKNLYLCNWGGVGSKTFANYFGRDYFKISNSVHHNSSVWHTHYPAIPKSYIPREAFIKSQDVIDEQNPIINIETKVVYMYGNPYNALLSYYRRSASDRTWIQRHCKDLNGQHEEIQPNWNIEDYLDNGEDLLGLMSHMDAWLTAKVDYKILFVRFEDMWDNFSDILDFLEIGQWYSNRFPPKRVRASDWTTCSIDIQNKLNTVYGKLKTKVDNMPAVFIKQPI